MSRVLLTGATGFVGAPTLTALVERGHRVHAVARTPGQPHPGVTWYQADLLRESAARDLVDQAKATQLVHLAWYAVPGKFWTAPENKRWVGATAALVRAFAAAGGKQVVVAGSCAEYRWDNEPLEELKSPLAPTTPYGEAKLAAHVEAGAVAQEHKLRLAWARLFFLYGPGERPGRLVPGVAAQCLRGKRVQTTEGTQGRDLLHVKDAARALVMLLESGVAGPVNICSGEATPVRDVVTLISKAAGAKNRIEFGALPVRPGDPQLVVGRTRRLRAEVGFAPSIGLAEGLRQTVEWWRKELGLVPARGRSEQPEAV
jgi:nucleoside-diphosphate-sugar epimerase